MNKLEKIGLLSVLNDALDLYSKDRETAKENFERKEQNKVYLDNQRHEANYFLGKMEGIKFAIAQVNEASTN